MSKRGKNAPEGLRRGIADVRQVMHLEQGASMVPAAFLLFGILDAVPIPTDAGYFYVQRWLDQNRDKLTDHKFWLMQYVNYYGWDVAWAMAMFAVTYFSGRTIGQKLVAALIAISAGSVAVEIWRFVANAPRGKRGLEPSKRRQLQGAA